MRVLTFIVALLAAIPAALAADGRALVVSGRVMLERASPGSFSITAIATGAEIHRGDRIRTGPDGRVQIRFSDGAIVSLQPGTDFRIDEYRFERDERRAFFFLLRGALRTVTGAIGKTNHDEYRMKTPTATVGVRGTEYVAEQTVCDPRCAPGPRAGLRVAVTQGRIALSTAAGTVEVGAGQSAAAESADTPPQRTERGPVLPPISHAEPRPPATSASVAGSAGSAGSAGAAGAANTVDVLRSGLTRGTSDAVQQLAPPGSNGSSRPPAAADQRSGAPGTLEATAFDALNAATGTATAPVDRDEASAGSTPDNDDFVDHWPRFVVNGASAAAVSPNERRAAQGVLQPISQLSAPDVPPTAEPDPGAPSPTDPDPDSTDPGGSDPGGSDPGGSDPGGSDPGGSDPGGSDPGGSDPGGSDPGGSDPGGSDPGGSDPGGSDPGGSDPGGSDPGGSDPGGSDPGGSDPDGSDPGGSDPGGSDPDGSDPDGSDPDGSDPDGSDPDGSDPDGSDPDGSDPDGSDPDGSDPDGSDPDGSDPDGSDPDGSDPDGSDPDGSDPDGSDPDGSDPDGSDPDGSDPDGSDPDGSDPDGSDPDGSDPDGSDPDGSDPDGSDPDGSDPDGSDPDGSDPDGSDPDPDTTEPAPPPLAGGTYPIDPQTPGGSGITLRMLEPWGYGIDRRIRAGGLELDDAMRLVAFEWCNIDWLCRISKGGTAIEDAGHDEWTSWGRWTGGSARAGPLGIVPLPIATDEGLHYLVGVPSTTIPTSGVFGYELVGATRATLSGGGPTGRFDGRAAVAFSPAGARIGIDANVAFADGSYRFTTPGGIDDPGQSPIASGAAHAFTGDAAVSASGSQPLDCSVGCAAQFDGGLFGPEAARLGFTYRITGSGDGPTISGVGVFGRKPQE